LITFTYHLEFLEEIRNNGKQHHPDYHDGISTTTNINNKTKRKQEKQLEKKYEWALIKIKQEIYNKIECTKYVF
jgi:hypothetical protein